MQDEIEEKEKSTAGAWILAILSIVYLISPIDIVPDIPVVGWIDDFFISATGILNLIQAEVSKTSQGIAQGIKMLKWLIIGIGIIAILLVLLLGSLIVSLFT